MTFLIYLLICCAIFLAFIFYGIRWQRQRQKAFLEEEMDYEETSNQ
jgi:preprotein translocase subunit YajC